MQEKRNSLSSVLERPYLEFFADGLSMGKREDLLAAGLKRSLGCPKRYPKTKQAFDDRILGEGSFVESILGHCEAQPVVQMRPRFEDILSSVCERFDIPEAAVLGRRLGSPTDSQ